MKPKQFTRAALAMIALMSSTAVFAQSNPQEVTFPELERAWLKGGTFINVEQLKRIGRGMTANQVRELISYPHFNEGFALSNWNYIFNFRTGRNDEFVTCQYQVQFKDGKSSAMYWRDPACAQYLNKKALVNQTHPISLASDGMFAFGRSDFSDLQPAGQLRLKELAAQINTGFSKVHNVNVVGYTDRIGSPVANLALSRARAETVKRFLVGEGVPADAIKTQGAGAANPLIICPGKATPAVITCLMPNRRIEVAVNGDK